MGCSQWCNNVGMRMGPIVMPKVAPPCHHDPRFPPGFQMYRGYFDIAAQRALLADIKAIAAAAPWFQPVMPGTGQPFSVRMTNAGPLGWVSDQSGGYRYQETHPVTGALWPPIPARILDLWRAVTTYPALPQCCLVNLYGHQKARMGLHIDGDEPARDAPVVSVSLGDPARFRLGGVARRDKSFSMRLESGDVVVLGGASRHRYHGIDRVDYGHNDLIWDFLATQGRINLTLRRVTALG